MYIARFRNGLLAAVCLLICIQSTEVAAQKVNAYHSFDNQEDHYIQWRGNASGGLILGFVTGFYIFTRPIYYNERAVKFHFSRHPDGRLTIFENRFRGLDKFGHIFSTSLFAQNIYFLSRWSGFSNKTSSYLGASVGLAIMTGMEVHDAHYERWGFSVGDQVANVLGSMLPIAQQNIPSLRKFDYKLSYDFTAEPSDTPIEDYENMTYWLTANPAGFFGESKPSWLPSFLNIAVGVGLSANDTRERELYIGLDYNLKNVIHTDSIYLNHLVALLDRFRLPAPAIRITPSFVSYGFFF